MNIKQTFHSQSINTTKYDKIPIEKEEIIKRNSQMDSAFKQQRPANQSSFQVIQSLHFNKELQSLTTILKDKYRCLSTHSTKIPQSLERKKYIEMKKKISSVAKQSSPLNPDNLKEQFNKRQTFLRNCLEDFASQIGRQCKQKEQILKYIWNSMSNIIQELLEYATINFLQKQKEDLTYALNSHQQYQYLLNKKVELQSQMQTIIVNQQNTIKTLISQMRIKRKQIQKSYKIQKLLKNELNEVRTNFIFVKKRYIEEIVSIKGMTDDRANILKQQLQLLNKNMNSKLYLKGNKNYNRKMIQQELKSKNQDDYLLREEIIGIVNSQLNQKENVGCLIDNAIQNFDFKLTNNKQQCLQFTQKTYKRQGLMKKTAKFDPFSEFEKESISVQFDYTQKLINKMVNNRNTQTIGDNNRKKIVINQKTQTQKEWIHIQQQTMKIQHSFNYTHYYHSLDPTISLRVNNKGHSHRKLKSQISQNQPFRQLKTHRKKNSESNIDFIEDSKKYSSEQNQLQTLQARQIQQSIDQKANQKKSFKLKKTLKAKPYNQFLKKNNNEPIYDKKKLKSIDKMKTKAYRQSLQQEITPYQQQEFVQNKNHRKDSQIKINILSESKAMSAQRLQKSLQNKKFIKFQHKDADAYNNIYIDENKKKQIFDFFLKKDHYIANFQEDLQDIRLQQNSPINQIQKLNLQLIKQKNAQSIRLSGIQQKQSIDSKKSKYLKKETGSKDKIRKKEIPNDNDLNNRLEKLKRMQCSKTDQNEMLLLLCRDRYTKQTNKMKNRIKMRRYMEDAVHIREKMQFIVKDVQLLIKNKSFLKKKNSNNVKNTYKIIMMTFLKAYDYYYKDILVSNLVNPLFESLTIVYGNIRHQEIYKRLVHFIASLTLIHDNSIFKFFVFFLGFESHSQYSSKVTMAEIQLCLKLLQQISIDGKITLNIDSIYTDIEIIKNQLINTLRQSNIPQSLLKFIQAKIINQLSRSNKQSNKSQESSQIKLNIYNVILLITKQIIKSKHALAQQFTPLFNIYQSYSVNHVVPIDLLDITLQIINQFYSRQGYKLISHSFKGSLITGAQFTAFLFENNLVQIQKILAGIHIDKQMKYPQNLKELMKDAIKQNNFKSDIQRKRYIFLDKILNMQTSSRLLQLLKQSICICEFNILTNSELKQKN